MPGLKKTPLYERHLQMKGKIIDFGGWLLPVEYGGIIEEVLHTRNKASLFDASHMGEILVEGPRAEDFLQKILTNDLGRLQDNGVMYSPACYPDGGTVDDILVYRYNRQRYLLVVNAANTEKDYNWFCAWLNPDVTIKNLSAAFALLALQGPDSPAILQQLTHVSLAGLKYYHFMPRVILAGAECMISRTGYTGEDGFEIFCPAQQAASLWDELFAAGNNNLELRPAGLGARDILRLEAALPLYGHELTREITPLEAGLARFVCFAKNTAFYGRETLARQHEEGLQQRLMGLVMLERGIPRAGYIVKKGEEEIGRVSSGSFCPSVGKSCALAFMHPQKVGEGDTVGVLIRQREYAARIVKIPFYRRG
ncbi:MAG: glycine cleavage system aminomethyltransferase GcvT [Bacillota bacterium]